MTRNALVVGCGKIGSELDEGMTGTVALTHATGYEMHEQTKLVAGVDPNPKRLSAFSSARDVPGYTDVESALSEHEIDLVSICTPPELHAEMVTQVVEADIDGILCEKPLTGDSKTARSVVLECRSNDVTLAVNYFRRYLPGCQLGRAMLSNGIIGENQHASLVYNKGFLNNGSHVVDLARWWFGDCTEVIAVEPDTPNAIATFGQTKCHLMHAGSSSYNHTQIDVYGDSGRLQLLEQGRRLQWQTSRDSPLFVGFRDLGDNKEMTTGFEWMNYFVVDDFVTAVQGPTEPACSGEDALQTLEICERFLS